MARSERWPAGWQEASFARVQELVRETPAFCLDIAPSDLVEDAYLLSLASTAFLRPDTVPEQPSAGVIVSAVDAVPIPVGVPAFQYERCLGPGHETSGVFAAALEGRHGAFHQRAARRAGTVDAWARSLAGLYGHGRLLGAIPAEPLRHEPVLPTAQAELRDCILAVGRTFVHALRIGFGLWGRWERA